ncbi:hypothetical protein IRT45_08240 [Nocardia sp. BSTN01]|uniref:hypothetical protein n=1 Tax=Nocardia sp. BSTN01 TaxID=2783665 RepID=UPI00188F033F|nr:hypothetical protein [Nocardia sp. BSTN01]MBF4997142.1 hypothetical protein [Nocardia sp. BSTN01]
MPELIAPTARLHRAWLDAHAEWGPGFHEDGFGLTPADEVDAQAGFTKWVERLASDSPSSRGSADRHGLLEYPSGTWQAVVHDAERSLLPAGS